MSLDFYCEKIKLLGMPNHVLGYLFWPVQCTCFAIKVLAKVLDVCSSCLFKKLFIHLSQTMQIKINSLAKFLGESN